MARVAWSQPAASCVDPGRDSAIGFTIGATVAQVEEEQGGQRGCWSRDAAEQGDEADER